MEAVQIFTLLLEDDKFKPHCYHSYLWPGELESVIGFALWVGRMSFLSSIPDQTYRYKKSPFYTVLSASQDP